MAARNRIGHLGISALCLILASAVAGKSPARPEAAGYDIVIRGGLIHTGETPPFLGDVAVRGDRIVYVGKMAPGPALKTIDARGLIVAPGFIDPHTHAGSALSSENSVARLVLPFLTQGVTTAFIGVDGDGDPDIARALGIAARGQGQVGAEAPRGWGINVAGYVGFGAVRSAVIGPADRAPTPAELERMKGLVAGAMCQGALGLSTGLFYAPQSFARQDEVMELARVASAAGGIYDSHLRDESSYSIGLLGAVDEAIAIGREAKIPVHIAHIKALGVDVQGMAPQVIARIEAARASGQVITADQYPWSASGTGLSAALIPRWAQDGGRAAMLGRFADAQLAPRLRAEIQENLRRRGGGQAVLITAGPDWAVGKTLAALALEKAIDPVSAAIELLKVSEISIASFNQSEADIAAFMKRDWVVTSSDASIGHPRYYASFSRKFATYVRERKVIDLRGFIASSTIRTARMFGLEGRGELRKGNYADVIAFDPAQFRPRADYAHPSLFSAGMRAVLVNGKLAIDNGEPTGIAAGRPLPRQPKMGACP
jgi:N-acyl-D-aspartate/D-glutamate deacylase